MPERLLLAVAHGNLPPVLKSNKLSFVLPVALKEPATGSWRRHVNDAAAARLRLTLLSFRTMFEQSDLEAFWIVCPKREVDRVTHVLRSVTSDPRYAVLNERDYVPETRMLGGETRPRACFRWM